MRPGALFGASLIAGELAIALARPAAAEIVVRVDKETQTMTVTVDRQVLYVWPVSTGMTGRDTPSGTFHPNRMDADHHSQEWDGAPMPSTIFFDMHGHAVHGFASITHLGNPASHGCVRLAPANAAILFDLVKMEKMHETTVVITGNTPSLQSLAELRRRDLHAANAALARETLSHRAGDPAQPYGKEAMAYVKEAAASPPLQTLAFDQLIPTPTFAMPGASWKRRSAAIAEPAAYVVPANLKSAPAEALPQSQPEPHAADRSQNEPATYARRPAASGLATAVHQQPPINFEALEAQAEEAPAVGVQPLPQPQPRAADRQPHRPLNNARPPAASALETAAAEQPAESEPPEAQAPGAPAAGEQQPPAYRRLQAYAQPPALPRPVRLPATSSRQQTAAYAQPYYQRQAEGYGPQLYYVLPPTYGQQLYYLVQPSYVQQRGNTLQPGYMQLQGYARPQYYQLNGQ